VQFKSDVFERVKNRDNEEKKEDTDWDRMRNTKKDIYRKKQKMCYRY
jgi:hypothetical protein